MHANAIGTLDGTLKSDNEKESTGSARVPRELHSESSASRGSSCAVRARAGSEWLLEPRGGLAARGVGGVGRGGRRLVLLVGCARLCLIAHAASAAADGYAATGNLRA